jgi:Ca-activated chloride channel family protein
MDLITSRADKEDGFFSLTLTAGQDLAKLDSGMDYVFVLDVSGSMGSDGKLAVSRESVAAFINELDEQDRFEVLTFNVQPNLLFRELRAAAPANRRQAQDFLAAQDGRGGTTLNPALQAAYRYANPDRTLNVLILSDGLTEQGERAVLTNLINRRPRNCRVFCVGVGNDVNRPLLEQMANDSGGLAAFVSRGDNFERQAKAFRRKLQHPAASELSVEIQGVDVYDLEPANLPSLFYGAPVRMYGRYRGSGPANVTLKGNIRGKELKTTAKLEFPAQDGANPEIERMWASRRVERLAKLTDDASTRDAAMAEIVRLGEAFSITSEWTSFLVLENDAEYARWKIERRNDQRLTRDRKAQDQRRAELDKIRERAAGDLGPQPLLVATAAKPEPAAGNPVPAVNAPASSRTPIPVPSSPSRSSNQSWDLRLPSGGSSPVGPLFVIVAAWLARRKNQVR